jgi:hypothetical protein
MGVPSETLLKTRSPVSVRLPPSRRHGGHGRFSELALDFEYLLVSPRARARAL